MHSRLLGIAAASCAALFGCSSGSGSNCVAACQGRSCGSDGCDGVCGTCPTGQACTVAGQCAPCTASCSGKVCGDDGCGGTCGSCTSGQACNAAGQCIACTPSCAGKVCGNDGCGGSCGTCSSGTCSAAGQCTGCTPSCSGKACGNDGCGGSCGTCPSGQSCGTNGQCTSTGPITLAAKAVGGYAQVGTNCPSGSPWSGYAFFFCPGGRVRGGGTMDGATELLCGNYTVSPAEVPGCTDKTTCFPWINFVGKDTIVIGGQTDVDPDFSLWIMMVEATAGTQLWRRAPCNDQSNGYIVLQRVASDVTGDYCISSACTNSNAGSCGTDCDCGHCWYCESGTCRYGGEGPYGCYRGCN